MITPWRKRLGVVKDSTSIGLAKIASPRVSDLDVAIVKATSHDDMAVDEKYTKEILHLTAASLGYTDFCLQALTRRISKTRDWIVAIKVLVLTHRLLHEGNFAFQEDMRTVSRLTLNVYDFRDKSHSNSWDYSAFVRTYAAYLDARLDCFTFSSAKSRVESRQDVYSSEYGKASYSSNSNRSGFSTNLGDTYMSIEPPYRKHKISVKEMELDILIGVLSNLQHMLERVLACYPTGVSKNHRLVQVSLYMIVKDSFQIYSDLRNGIALLLNVYFEMKLEDCSRTFDIYARFAKQSDSLSSFYMGMNICRPSQYPPIEKVSRNYLDILEDFLRNRSRSACSHQPNRSHFSNKKLSVLGPHSEKEKDPVTYHSMYGIKALPATRTEIPHTISDRSTMSKPEKQPNLIGLEDEECSTETGHLANVKAPPMVGSYDRFHFETAYNQATFVHNSATAHLDVAIGKATCQDDMNVDEKHTQKVLHLTATSLGHANFCLQALTKRISKTRYWIVAIKVLVLTHRLLREGIFAFEELLRTVSRLTLNVCDFRDKSHSSNSWDYSAFIRTYAAYIDARLDCFIFASSPGIARSRQDDYSSGYGETRYSLHNSRSNFNTSSCDAESPYKKQKVQVKEMEPDMLIQVLPNLQNMLERVLDCRPRGVAKNHPLVQVSLYIIVKDSFQIYSDLCEGIGTLLNVYFDMKLEDCSRTFEIYARFAKQSDSLSSFYKGMGICRPFECPPVQKVSQVFLDTLEDFLRDRSCSALLQQPNRSRDSNNKKSLGQHSEKKKHSVTYENLYGMKTLPARPTEKPQTISCGSAISALEKQPDLVGFEDEGGSTESGHDKMALALFSNSRRENISNSWATFDTALVQESSQNTAITSTQWQQSSDTAKACPSGWELALVSEAACSLTNAKAAAPPMLGSFDLFQPETLSTFQTECTISNSWATFDT